MKEEETYEFYREQTLLLTEEYKELKERIDKAIENNERIIKDTKKFYRPTKDIIYSGDSLIDIATQNLDILKGRDK